MGLGPPSAICQLVPNNNSTNLLLNRTKPPFDNADIRRAVMLALDRKSFIQILGEGQGDAGGALLPPPEGLWGLPPDQLANLVDALDKAGFLDSPAFGERRQRVMLQHRASLR